jgi:hypothetical protein
MTVEISSLHRGYGTISCPHKKSTDSREPAFITIVIKGLPE